MPSSDGNDRNELCHWPCFRLCDPVRVFSPILSAATSTYRPPEVVTSLALDVAGRGVYEIHQRPLGLVRGKYHAPTKALDSPFLQADWNRGIVTIQKDDQQLILDFNMK